MIKLGFILPEPELSLLTPQDDFHLVLPHLFATHPTYLSFYQHRASIGDFVMCDNSVFELGTSLEDNALLDAALQIGASEVVSPEILRKSTATLRRVDRFLTLVENRDLQLSVAAVVQGEKLEELTECFVSYLKNDRVSTICVPFDIDFDTPLTQNISSVTLRRVLGRVFVLDHFVRVLKESSLPSKPVHLLGLADGVELQFQTKHSFIRSNDSSSAFIHGLFYYKYSERGLPVEKLLPKMDFKWRIENSQQRECILHNIELLKRFAGYD